MNNSLIQNKDSESPANRDELFAACKDIATAPDILGLFITNVHRSGLINEEHNAKLLYLAMLTRHFEEPVCVVVQGPSAGGQSFLIKKVLPFFSRIAYNTMSAMSDKALARWDENMQHRVLVVYELAGIGTGQGLPMVRSLITEGHIRYLVSVPTQDGNWKSEPIEFKGPTGLVMTTTKVKLHPEDATRFLSLTVCDTPEQTSQVIKAVMTGANTASGDVNFDPWHALDRLLRMTPPKFCIPFDEELAGMISPVAMRLKRDILRFRSIMCAHAFLHQNTREQDGEDSIIVTLEDYRVAYELMADLLAEAVEATVPPFIRETVEAVGVPSEPSTEKPKWDAFMDTNVKDVDGVSDASCNRDDNTCTISGEKISVEALVKALNDIGFNATVDSGDDE